MSPAIASSIADTDGAPPHVALVGDFVNTVELQVAAEALTGPEQLRDWFAARGLVDTDVRLAETDVVWAIGVREGFRTVLLAHAGHAAEATAIADLNRALAAAPVRVSFDSSGAPRLTAAVETPAHQGVAAILDSVRRASEDGTWERLKVCARDTCRWAYYDSSRNRAGRWCSMAGCGNYVKMKRAYAVRKARADGRSD